MARNPAIAKPSDPTADVTGTPVPVPGPIAPPPQYDMPGGIDFSYQDRYRSYPSRNLTPNKIAMILEQADHGDYFEFAQLCDEILEKDPKIMSILHTRVGAVVGTDHEIVPVDLDDDSSEDADTANSYADFCNAKLARANLDDLITQLLDSVMRPVAVSWINWQIDLMGNVVPQKFRQVPLRHLRWSIWSDTIRVWDPYSPNVPVQDGNGGGDFGQVFAPYTTVRAINNERRDHPTRSGLLRTLVWYYFFKSIAIKDMVSFADRYGYPVRILSLDPADFKNPAMYGAAQAALKNIGADASGIISNNAKLDLHSPTGKNGPDVYMAIINYIDTAMAQLVLGHELSSQGSRGGGNLGISAAEQVRQDYLEGDCVFLAEIIRRDVLVPMIGWNFGWEQAERLAPEIEFDYEPPTDLTAEANRMALIARTFPSLQFSEQQVRGDFGVSAPIDDDEDVLLTGLAPAPAEVPASELPVPEPVDPAVGTLPISAPAIAPTVISSEKADLRKRQIETLRVAILKAGAQLEALPTPDDSETPLPSSLRGWRKLWLLSPDHDGDDVCDDNADQDEVPLNGDFESGDPAPPAHPNCDCQVVILPKSDGSSVPASQKPTGLDQVELR